MCMRVCAGPHKEKHGVRPRRTTGCGGEGALNHRGRGARANFGAARTRQPARYARRRVEPALDDLVARPQTSWKRILCALPVGDVAAAKRATREPPPCTPQTPHHVRPWTAGATLVTLPSARATRAKAPSAAPRMSEAPSAAKAAVEATTPERTSPVGNQAPLPDRENVATKCSPSNATAAL
mmetsp:Transcript_4928/g.14405  ORF Transcript_4928/g.14405 Transcript_4928/m.14405 type:complete len:182 (+) Transcript_4928:1-546(+)